jgi:hypothetical protein
MVVRSGDDLRRRHEGYLCNDLLAATFRSNREVDVFVQRTTRQNFLGIRPPTRRDLSTRIGVHAAEFKIGGRPWVFACAAHSVCIRPPTRRDLSTRIGVHAAEFKIGGRPWVFACAADYVSITNCMHEADKLIYNIFREVIFGLFFLFLI